MTARATAKPANPQQDLAPDSDAAPLMPRLLWTKPEAAQLLNLGLTTVTQLVVSGDLPSVKIGARRLIKHTDLVAYVDALPAAPPEARAA